MDILFVTPFLPTPLRKTLHDRIKGLFESGHRIHLVSLCHSVDEFTRFEASAAKYCASVETISHSRRRAIINCLRYLPTPIPLREAYFFSPQLQWRLRKVILERQFDIIHATYLRGASLSLALKESGIPSVLDLIDCTTAYVESQLHNVRSPVLLPLLVSEYLRIERYEREIASQFDAVLLVSERDFHRFNAVMNRRTNHAYVDWFFSTDLSYLQYWHGHRDVHRIVFVGGLKYKPNIDGIYWFLSRIWPMVKERISDARLDIVGADPPERLRKFADANVTVTGWVDDIRPYVSRANLSVCPILVGAGAQNKVVESMALGTPVVSTVFGAGGLEVRDEETILVADEPRRFAEKVILLMSDSVLWRKLSENGRRLVQEKYDLDAATKKLEQIYSELVSLRRSNHANIG